MNLSVPLAATVLAGAALLASAGAAHACPAGATNSSTAPTSAAAVSALPPAPAQRTITIGGRQVTVTVSLLRHYEAGTPEDLPPPKTRAAVTISVNDGALLPAGLRAARVRFERLRGTDRVFSATLAEDSLTVPGDEPDTKSYAADISGRSAPVVRLRTTVRLLLNGRPILVPMGVVPIYAPTILQ